jgi:hypothetical protein
MNLSDVLKTTYKNQEEQQKYFSGNNYIRDNQLSNANQQAYFNKDENKLLINVTGSHQLSDFFVDENLLFGNLKNTNRYKEADKLLKLAKEKYKPSKTTITGHSLGASIGALIGSKEDKILTLDKGSTFGTRTRANENSYRTTGDLVSLLGSGSKRVKTLKNPNQNYFKNGLLGQIYQAHDINNIKNSGLYI